MKSASMHSYFPHTALITYLVRSKLHSGVDVNQLEGHSEVLVAVCGEGALGLGGVVHSVSFKKKKKKNNIYNPTVMSLRFRGNSAVKLEF